VKSLLTLLSALMLTLGMVMAQQEATPEDEQAMLRVAHLAPDADDVNVTIDGQNIHEGLAFRDVSDYESVASGETQVEVMENDEEVFSGPFELEAGMYYTLVVLPGEAEEDLQVMLLRDEVTVSPEMEQVLVRVFHAKYDAGDVDVVVADNDNGTLIEGLGFSEVTGYFTLDADAELEIREAGSDDAIVEVSSDEFESGNVYTVFITEDDDGDPDVLVEEDDIDVDPDEM
jgi:hypothetical protein